VNEQQLPLGFRLRDDATFENYFSESNTQALHAILSLVCGRGDNFLYLWGTEGSGRSHLLQASCHAAPEFKHTAVYLPLEDLENLSPDIFLGLENIALVCIDDVYKIAGNPVWEEQLFHLFNRIRANGNKATGSKI
jgi:DnaA family protein